MRVLIIHRYFWPDRPAYAVMLRAMAGRLAAAGHEVTVLTAQPSYGGPGQQRAAAEEQLDGFRVLRVDLFAETKKSLWRKAINLALFRWKIRRVARREGPFDVIMAATTPPVYVAATALRLAREQGASFVYHNQDIYPEIAVAIGAIRRQAFVARLKRDDQRVLEGASRVVVLSEDMARAQRQRGADPSKLRIRNNFCLPRFDDGEPAEAAAAEWTPPPQWDAEDTRFRVLFAGNLGRFQCLDQVMDAAHALAGEREVRFDFVGDGAARADLEQQAGELLGQSVYFHGFVSTDMVRQMTAQADLSLITLAPEVIRYAYPSKLMTYLEAGAVLLAVLEEDSELATTVREEGVGFTCPAAGGEVIAAAIREARDRRAEADAMRARSRALAERAFGAERALDDWQALFAELEAERGGGA